MSTTPPADFYEDGQWNFTCYFCGRKRKSSEGRKHWQGFYICLDHDPGLLTRQPQDFVRGIPDGQAPPWVQPQPADDFTLFCSPNGMSAVPGEATPGCVIPGYLSPAYLP